MRASRSDYAGNWVNIRQKKFRGKFRYSARTRVIIEEKSVRIVQRLKNPAARTIHRLALTANHNSLRSRLPEGPRPASGSLDADTPRLCRYAASIAGEWKIQPLEKQLPARSYQPLPKPKANVTHDGPTTAGLQPTTTGPPRRACSTKEKQAQGSRKKPLNHRGHRGRRGNFGVHASRDRRFV